MSTNVTPETASQPDRIKTSDHPLPPDLDGQDNSIPLPDLFFTSDAGDGLSWSKLGTDLELSSPSLSKFNDPEVEPRLRSLTVNTIWYVLTAIKMGI